MKNITRFFNKYIFLKCIADLNLKVDPIELFKKSPNSWYYEFPDKPFQWPVKPQNSVISIGDIYIFVGGSTIGYIHNIKCHGNIAKIGHFAVEQGLERMGIGRIMALSIAKELKERYGISTIIFSENSTKFIEADYPKFFNALGALPMPIDLKIYKSDRPDFEWKI